LYGNDDECSECGRQEILARPASPSFGAAKESVSAKRTHLLAQSADGTPLQKITNGTKIQAENHAGIA
jgi:hypothetical protein